MDMSKWPVVCGIALLLLSACKSGQQRTPYTPADEMAGDTINTDSADSLEQFGEGSRMPIAADELFDDFFFNYAANKRLQLERTTFPLPILKDGKKESLTSKQWKMEYFFKEQDFYTLLFDSPQQMELVKDTAVDHAVVERIMLEKNVVCQYQFNRRKGCWMLNEINYQPLPHNPNAQFFSFYQQFVSDSLFQHHSLSDQIAFVGPDPEDDFQMVEGFISPDSWDAFRPDFPVGELYNIVYGHQNPASTQKIFVIRGISNGLEVEVTFKLRNGKWKVVKLIT